MPHILVTPHSDIDVCSKNDKINFDFVATSHFDQKIGVKTANKEFMLTKVAKKENFLIKLDVPTRLSPVSLMKEALNTYAQKIEAQLLFSNTNSFVANKVAPQEEYLKSIDYFVDEFQTDKEIWIEVGFGSGVHLLHQAKSNPDKLLIGLEIHTPSIEQVLKQCKLQNITNVLVVNYDARLFLEFLDSNSVGRVFVHFPVPWDKKPHRRVMSIPFIEESMRVLKVGGTLELRTDSPNYYEYNLEILEHFKEYESTIRSNEDLDVVSKYEARWKRQEKTIWDITIKSKEQSQPKILKGDFKFDGSFDTELIKNNIQRKAIIQEDYLVHFEDLYDVQFCDSKGLLIKLTLGSFNRPVTKYILVQNNKARYFQGDPIKTRSNLLSHELVLKSLQ